MPHITQRNFLLAHILLSFSTQFGQSFRKTLVLHTGCWTDTKRISPAPSTSPLAHFQEAARNFALVEDRLHLTSQDSHAANRRFPTGACCRCAKLASKLAYVRSPCAHCASARAACFATRRCSCYSFASLGLNGHASFASSSSSSS